MEIEKIIMENAIQIAKNTANINILMKLMYIVISGILAQIILSVKGLFNGKKNK